MLKEYYLWRCRRLHRKLTIVQFKVSEMTKHQEAKKLNRRKK